MDTPEPPAADTARPRGNWPGPGPAADAGPEDLRQVAGLALAKAIRKYRRSVGMVFVPKPVPAVLAALRRRLPRRADGLHGAPFVRRDQDSGTVLSPYLDKATWPHSDALQILKSRSIDLNLKPQDGDGSTSQQSTASEAEQQAPRGLGAKGSET